MKSGSGIDQSAPEMYIRTGLFSKKHALIQINSEKPYSLSYTRAEPSFLFLQVVSQESVFGRRFFHEGSKSVLAG